MIKKIGVVIGRFQVPDLHEGHNSLINMVRTLSDELVILVGSAGVKSVDKNPLCFETRKLMIKSIFENVIVEGIRDFKLNEKWSENVDTILGKIVSELQSHTSDLYEITLYGGRDSFTDKYSGKYRVIELKEAIIDNVDGTSIRRQLAINPMNSHDFRCGVIHAVEHLYPTAFPTVDIAILNGKGQVLLGRKEFEKIFRFIGGFVDPTDLNMEGAAKRECLEEVGENVLLENFTYIGSMKVNDWRYRHSKNGIITTFFKCQYVGGEIQASDDIVECVWKNISELDEMNMVGEHLQLLEMLRKSIN